MVHGQHWRSSRVSLGLIVEGKADKRPLPTILRICCQASGSVHVRRAGNGVGDALNAAKVAGVARSLLSQHSDIDRVVVCIDLDGRPERHALAMQVQAGVRQHVTVPVTYCPAEQAVEAWFLCDENALRQVVGPRVSAVSGDVSALAQPSKDLRRLFNKAGKGYSKVVDNLHLAEKLDCARVSGRSPSFRTFLQAACS